jgi:hypothetical protein
MFYLRILILLMTFNAQMKPVFLWLNKIITYRATNTDPNFPLPKRAPNTKSSRRKHLLSLIGSRQDLALIDSYL